MKEKLGVFENCNFELFVRFFLKGCVIGLLFSFGLLLGIMVFFC